MNIFFADRQNNREISWNDLIDDLNHTTTYNPYCSDSDFYEVFKHIILSLLLGKKIILLDSDFTTEEIHKLTSFTDLTGFTERLSKYQLNLSSKINLIENILNTGENWEMTLFTSGTTGLPKKVSHSFKSITRFVKKSEQNKNDIWGFAYNPTHMAGIQVFFQAFLNENPLIRLFGLDKEEIFYSIDQYNISHISATPTFYRLLLPSSNTFDNVKRITSGGEKFDNTTTEQLKKLYPSAKINNVYASTEAGTLFASKNDVFYIKPELKDLVKIEDRLLLIHNSLLGKTERKSGTWYNTGDLVEIISENPLQFKFISREDDLINVGGYKVNPVEVEETIRNLKGVIDVRVYAKKNSVLGNIVQCEVKRDDKKLDELTIRMHLQKKLQEFKIPRVIKFVENLSTTRTGKIKRN